MKIQEKYQISFCKIRKKQMVPCKSTAEEVSFKWSHHRISFTHAEVRTTLHVCIIDFGIERVTLDNSNICSLNSSVATATAMHP